MHSIMYVLLYSVLSSKVQCRMSVVQIVSLDLPSVRQLPLGVLNFFKSKQTCVLRSIGIQVFFLCDLLDRDRECCLDFVLFCDKHTFIHPLRHMCRLYHCGNPHLLEDCLILLSHVRWSLMHTASLRLTSEPLDQLLSTLHP